MDVRGQVSDICFLPKVIQYALTHSPKGDTVQQLYETEYQLWCFMYRADKSLASLSQGDAILQTASSLLLGLLASMAGVWLEYG